MVKSDQVQWPHDHDPLRHRDDAHDTGAIWCHDRPRDGDHRRPHLERPKFHGRQCWSTAYVDSSLTECRLRPRRAAGDPHRHELRGRHDGQDRQ